MKIRFENNSVSGVSRKYRGFSLEIPGRKTVTVDVPDRYANDALAYMKKRHPAIICLPAKPVEACPDPAPAADDEKADETEGAAETETDETETDETEGAEPAAEPKPKPKKKGKK